MDYSLSTRGLGCILNIWSFKNKKFILHKKESPVLHFYVLPFILIANFFLCHKDNLEREVEEYLWRRYERKISSIEIVEKEDLDLVSLFVSKQ